MAFASSKGTRLRGVDTAGIRLRLVDAKEQVVGRLAAQISRVLQGKDKPTFANHLDNGDVVIVKNARHVEFTGKKWEKKVYRWHTGYPGGLKERLAKDQFDLDPGSILYKAVYGMLPKNRLRNDRARKLRIFPDEEHPFENDPRIVPWTMPPRKLRVKEQLFALPEGFEPLNRDAYRKRYGHQLREDMVQQLKQPASSHTIPEAAKE